MEQEDLEELHTYLWKNPGFAPINRKVAGKLKAGAHEINWLA